MLLTGNRSTGLLQKSTAEYLSFLVAVTKSEKNSYKGGSPGIVWFTSTWLSGAGPTRGQADLCGKNVCSDCLPRAHRNHGTSPVTPFPQSLPPIVSRTSQIVLPARHQA